MENEIYVVKIDQPIGSSSPDYPAMVYPVNCGYIEGIQGQEGRAQEAYVLGVDIPVDSFCGQRIAVIRRRDGQGSPWVVVPEEILYTKQQIEEMVHFQEQYYDSQVEMVNEELWDAYYRQGEKLGYQIPRSMAKSLPDGVYHIVVYIYTVTADGLLLATQRAKNKTYPFKWEVTGGSILTGESPQIGAARELFEETGISKDAGELEELYTYIDDRRHCIYHSYIARVKQEPHIHLQTGETINYAWLPYHKFRNLVHSDRFIPSEQERFRIHEGLITQKL